jgi:hypothetical protein
MDSVERWIMIATAIFFGFLVAGVVLLELVPP